MNFQLKTIFLIFFGLCFLTTCFTSRLFAQCFLTEGLSEEEQTQITVQMFDDGLYQEAWNTAACYLEEFRRGSSREKMMFMQALASQQAGSMTQALRDLQNFQKMFPGSREFQEEVLFRKGVVLAKIHQYSGALQTLKLLLREYPATQFKDQTLYWQGFVTFYRAELIRQETTLKEAVPEFKQVTIQLESLNPTVGVLGDIAHVANGNLRKAIFTLQLLAQRSLLDDRKNIQLLMANSSRREIQLVLEEALRGRVHDWKWEKQGEKNTRVLKGAMGALDLMMNNHDLDGRGVVDRLHHFLVAGRTHYPDGLLAELLNAVSRCDMRLQRSAQQRIQLEELLHRIAEIGQEHLGPSASQAS